MPRNAQDNDDPIEWTADEVSEFYVLRDGEYFDDAGNVRTMSEEEWLETQADDELNYRLDYHEDRCLTDRDP